jgi:hypothetical protein
MAESQSAHELLQVCEASAWWTEVLPGTQSKLPVVYSIIPYYYRDTTRERYILTTYACQRGRTCCLMAESQSAQRGSRPTSSCRSERPVRGVKSPPTRKSRGSGAASTSVTRASVPSSNSSPSSNSAFSASACALADRQIVEVDRYVACI